MNRARLLFLGGTIAFCSGDILGIFELYREYSIALFFFGMIALGIKIQRVFLLVVMVSLSIGYILGHSANMKSRENYTFLRTLTKDFTQKGNLIIEIDKKLYQRERTAVYRGYIANFDTFANFDIGKNIGITSPLREKHTLSIFVEVPENLSISAGDTLSWTGKVEENISFPLIGYEKYAYFQGGYGRIYMTNFRKISHGKQSTIDIFRRGWTQLFQSYFPEAVAGTLLGMTVGSIDLLTKEVKQAFLASGTSHILVVSGANIAFLILLTTFFLKYIHIGRILRISIIGVIILFYGTLVGWDVSVVRAVIMGMLSYTIVENGSRGSSRAILALTAILLILYEPLSIVYDAGFGLSFGATLGILIFQKSIAKYGKRYGVPLLITAIISVSIGAFLGSLPVVIYHFEQIAIVSLIANLLIGALLGWILGMSVAWALVASISHLGAVFIGWLVYLPTQYIIHISSIFQHGPILYIPHIYAPYISLFFLGILTFFYIESELDTK